MCSATPLSHLNFLQVEMGEQNLRGVQVTEKRPAWQLRKYPQIQGREHNNVFSVLFSPKNSILFSSKE